MFEETLLIIKNEYMSKRKILLIKLLGYGFQIQTNRRVLFTPELAAQFYDDNAECENFMLQVTLLSKGPAEAFILTMENAVKQLMTSTICYFCTSVEADRYVHVSKTLKDACREIKFIFPNYISEPITYFDKSTFCRDNNMSATIAEIYDILKTKTDEPKVDWKLRLANWLQKSNTNLPIVSNECVVKPYIGREEKSCQTKAACKKDKQYGNVSSSTIPGSSALFTTSSCISCHAFESSVRSLDVCKDLVAAKKKVLCETETEMCRKARMKSEEEQFAEENICDGETDVEYIIEQEEQTEECKVEAERIVYDEEQAFDEYVADEADIKFPETPSRFSVVEIISDHKADVIEEVKHKDA